MVRKWLLSIMVVCVVVAVAAGCGGEGKPAEVSETMAPVENNPSLQEAVRAEEAGEPLSGSQQRMLRDAREEGVIQ